MHPELVSIQPIAAAQTYALRHAVLWPDQPLSYVQLPEDAAGQHFGAFAAGALVAVISLFVGADGEARFRKFATEPSWQGRGVGTALLRHIIAVAQAQGAHALWCDARQNALPFYQRFGLQAEGDVFYKGDIPYLRLRRALP
ncbi:GNAT family N-acetyltransferase [Hymenobacter sp. HMF4947]|uniref:GNAT family N-acetyltransferase n=1 Tax=Hymenobacter ginkgonis TaxID=2682976 RepID=A0A7K1TA82_9BACT|nr:GNAT family N-acetyltransferase [Hymenobacter ginkgonis]MVN75299.1 GNAT family N-acetyltransferase [Hymenobacter ginkgonis]